MSAFGAKQTSRERSERVDLTKLTRSGIRVASATAGRL